MASGISVPVPRGWKRLASNASVLYISPSTDRLFTLDEVKEYLRRDGSCKCGLPCPLNPSKIFCFNPILSTAKYQFPQEGRDFCVKHLEKIYAKCMTAPVAVVTQAMDISSFMETIEKVPNLGYDHRLHTRDGRSVNSSPETPLTQEEHDSYKQWIDECVLTSPKPEQDDDETLLYKPRFSAFPISPDSERRLWEGNPPPLLPPVTAITQPNHSNSLTMRTMAGQILSGKLHTSTCRWSAPAASHPVEEWNQWREILVPSFNRLKQVVSRITSDSPSPHTLTNVHASAIIGDIVSKVSMSSKGKSYADGWTTSQPQATPQYRPNYPPHPYNSCNFPNQYPQRPDPLQLLLVLAEEANFDPSGLLSLFQQQQWVVQQLQQQLTNLFLSMLQAKHGSGKVASQLSFLQQALVAESQGGPMQPPGPLVSALAQLAQQNNIWSRLPWESHMHHQVPPLHHRPVHYQQPDGYYAHHPRNRHAWHPYNNHPRLVEILSGSSGDWLVKIARQRPKH